jgi:PAS domain S-box-containing protein
MVLDRELRYVAVNRAYCEAVSRAAEDLLGKQMIEVFPHDASNANNESARRLVDSFHRVFETGAQDVLPLIHYRIEVDGRYQDRYWSATHTPLFDAEGRVEHVLQHTVDITELHHHRRASQEMGVLQRAKVIEQRNVELTGNLDVLTRAFAGAPGFMCVLRGPELVVEIANEAYHQLVGEGRTLIGRSIREALPEVEERYLEILSDVMRTGVSYVGRAERVMLQRSPGAPPDEVVVDFGFQPIVDADGTPIGVFVLGHDITRQYAAEREMDRLNRWLEAIYDSFPEPLVTGDHRGVTRANTAARDMLGYPAVSDVLRPVADVAAEIAPRDPATGAPIPACELPYARALRGEQMRMEVLLRRADTGEERHVFASAAPVIVDGETAGAIVAHVDITEQKRVESEMLRLARVLDATRDFVGIAKLDGTPTFVNTAGLAMMGLRDVDQSRELGVVNHFIEEERDRVRNEVLPAALRDNYWEGELTFKHAQTGEHIPVSCAVFPLRDRSGMITALATITRDLREQKVVEEERARLLEGERAARAQAEQANESKDHFLATISHELRTPLTAILGWMQMLRAGMVTPEKHDRALETVERNARIQAQLIDDLLDVSRILSGKLDLELEAVEITSVVAAAVETVRPVADAKGVAITMTIDTCAPLIGDTRRLQQVVWNLLSNAVKFTPRGGSVNLHLDRVDDRIEIAVTDTGAGIAPDFLPHVFERFRQADASAARSKGGLGLGLSIVQHVVTAHGGEVSAFSEGKGKGARFVVALPVSINAPNLRGPQHDGAIIEAPATLTGRQVVIVDDEDDTREYIAALLRKGGMHVTVTATAEEALEAIEREHPDLLVSDLAMPGHDGFQLVQRLRSMPAAHGGRTPAIALTAFARAEDRMRAMRAGFQNHVAKPVDPAELFAVLAATVGGARN